MPTIKHFTDSRYGHSPADLLAASRQIECWLGRRPGIRRLLIYGFSRSGRFLTEHLVEHCQVAIAGVVDRSLVDTDELPYPLISNLSMAPTFDALIVCVAPVHYKAVDRALEGQLTGQESEDATQVLYLFSDSVDAEQIDSRWYKSPHKVSAARNFVRYLENINRADPWADNHPWFAYIEPSRNCNLRCPGCHADDPNIYSNPSAADFARAIDEVGKYLYHLSLFRGGEAFANKHFFEMLRAGASGYVPKRAAPDELVTAIRTVYRGDVFLYPSLAARLVQNYLGQSDPTTPTTLDNLNNLLWFVYHRNQF